MNNNYFGSTSFMQTPVPSYVAGPYWGPRSRDERGTWCTDKEGRAHWNPFVSYTGYDWMGRRIGPDGLPVAQGQHYQSYPQQHPQQYSQQYPQQYPQQQYNAGPPAHGNYCNLVVNNDGRALHVTVQDCSINNPRERKPDPYVELRAGRDVQRTRKQKNTSYCTFDETLTLGVPSDGLRVRVMDSDINRDDVMYEDFIPIHAMPMGLSNHVAQMGGAQAQGNPNRAFSM